VTLASVGSSLRSRGYNLEALYKSTRVWLAPSFLKSSDPGRNRAVSALERFQQYNTMSKVLKYGSKLSNINILIVGGSSGIGFAVAEAVLEHGASVTIASSSSERVQAALDRLGNAYPKAAKSRLSGYTVDLGGDDVEEQIIELFNKTGKLHHIIHTAGDKLATLPLQDTTLEIFRRAGNVRFFSPFLLAKIGSRYLLPSVQSSITFTAGTVCKKPLSQWTVVASYDAGLHGMVRSLALELKPIRVNLVCPGAVRTEMWTDLSPEEQAGFERSATGQIARPEDVAEAYLYGMKDYNLTGSVLNTNGGSLLF
jgi:NAD(P)-dependent dehydrogenase (short-subunit alcohol dehydrogenase family)